MSRDDNGKEIPQSILTRSMASCGPEVDLLLGPSLNACHFPVDWDAGTHASSHGTLLDIMGCHPGSPPSLLVIIDGNELPRHTQHQQT